ncbi:MAG: demethylmenaquinone methyltransferase [Acidimicrobiia bacterium]|nr:MAG: demethylmenaquinone methyltransferase [Acidimicrobiia bacterium]
MVANIAPKAGDRILDVAAGTGSITRRLAAAGADVVSLDQSYEMLIQAVERGAAGIIATAEQLPFADDEFDAVTFGYLLRYVDSVPGAMTEITRVVRPGGKVGMVEFGRPSGGWRPLWWCFTRLFLPVAGWMISRPWQDVGSFLGPSIDAFADRWTPPRLAAAWEEAGLTDVTVVRMSLGGGLVATATKP